MPTFKQERMQLHQQAHKWIQQSEFIKAEALLQQALVNCGPHVGLLSDICSMQYMTHNFSAFADSVLRLEKNFLECQHLLSDESYLRTTLTLGKFFEELLMVAEALSYYEKGKNKNIVPGSFQSLISKHEAQKLRLLSSLGAASSDLGESYKKCLSISHDKDLFVEISHALLLAEMEISGISLAYARLKIILEDSAILPWESRLLFYDFIEVSIRRSLLSEKLRYELREDLKKYPILHDTDPYEKTLMHILNGEFDLAFPYLLSLELSPFCRLKILGLLAREGSAEDFAGPYRLLTGDLSSPSKSYIDESFGRFFRTDGITVSLDCEGLLNIGKESLIFKKNSFQFRIITLLLEEKVVSTETAIQKIYDEEFSESSFLKLRVSISRLNKTLEKRSGISKVIQIKDGKIQFSTRIRQRRFSVESKS